MSPRFVREKPASQGHPYGADFPYRFNRLGLNPEIS